MLFCSMVCGFLVSWLPCFSARLDNAQFRNAQNLTFQNCFVSHAYTLFFSYARKRF